MKKKMKSLRKHARGRDTPSNSLMSSFPELQNRNVIVTGGASGIGAAIVRAFHHQGARVFFCDVDVKMGRALATSGIWMATG